jgi:tetraacyldisaccharide 4'-kinase
MTRRGADLMHRIWRSPSPGATGIRWLLLPAAALYRAGTALRNAAYDRGLLRARPLPVPSIGVGNLSVGGTGKTPLTAWIAGELARRGLAVGIVLRGYGDDETLEHQAANPGAIVEADADRHAAAARAVARGAQVLVLDDCLQRRDVVTDVMLALVSAESWTPVRWPLPAGPWREGLAALGRADAVVVTRKAAGRDEAGALCRRLAPRAKGGIGIVAALEPAALRPASGGQELPLEVLRHRDVLVVAGIGEPDLVAAQLQRLEARIKLVALDDHHVYDELEAARLAAAVPPGGMAVTTAKDAVKLASLWPGGDPVLFVAALRVAVDAGAEALEVLLGRVATAARSPRNPGAAAAPSARDP